MCYLPTANENSKKRANESTMDEPTCKRAKCVKSNEAKTSEAKRVFDTLTEKHDGRYKPEQLHAWAQLVQMKKHKSLEPPDYPFWMPRTTQQEEMSVDKGEYNSPNGRPIVISPGKKIHMHTLCIEQLQKIDQLLKKW